MYPDHSNHITPTEFIEALESEALTGFLHSLNSSGKPILSVTLPVADIDPLVALELHPDQSGKFYWDHPDNEISISAGGQVRELKSTGSRRFGDIARQTTFLKDQIDAYTAFDHSMAGPLFLGGYSFTDHNIGRVWKKFGAARFVLPEWMLVRSGGLHLLTLVIEKNGSDAGEIYQKIISRLTDFLNLAGKLQYAPPKMPEENYTFHPPSHSDEKNLWYNKVGLAKELILRNRFEKIVLARSVTLRSKNRPEPTILAHRLRQTYPECYNFLIQIDHETSFIGATPERLASFSNGVVVTEGLAGSISRGRSAMEDASLARSLLASRKDRDEHNFVVRAIDQGLKRFSLQVEHPVQPQIKKFRNVQHLFTPISASIKDGVQIHELLSELHPTPAVGGYPGREAVSYIRDIEQMERGWYAAPVGWFNMNGFGEFAVALRSALLHNDNAILYAGCGIVSDSDPKTEWDETMLKFRPMMDALRVSNGEMPDSKNSF